MYMLGGGMKSELLAFFLLTYLFFRKRKEQDVNAISKHRPKKKRPRCERNVETSNPAGFEQIDPSQRVLAYVWK